MDDCLYLIKIVNCIIHVTDCLGNTCGYTGIEKVSKDFVVLSPGSVRIPVETVPGVSDFNQFFTNYFIECVNGGVVTTGEKKYLEEIYRYDDKERVAIHLYLEDDGTTLCAFLAGDTNLTNNIINDPIMNNVGLPPELKPITTGYIPFEFKPVGGLTGTMQDLLDFMNTNPDFTLPGGVAPDGIIEFELDAEFKGNTTAGTVNTAQGFTFGTAPNAISFDGGQGTSAKMPWCDEDCDGAADMCFDLTTALIIPDGAGVSGKVRGVNCDADPANAVVN